MVGHYLLIYVQKQTYHTFKYYYIYSVYDDDTKTIRLNANLIALFKFANKNIILDDVYPTMSAFINEEQFRNSYDYATVESYDALVIDATKGRPIFKRILKVS